MVGAMALSSASKRARVHLGDTETPAQGVVVGEHPLDLGFQGVFVGEIDHRMARAADLGPRSRGPMPRFVVPILSPAFEVSREMVELAVKRQDQGGVVGDAQRSG